MTEKQRKLEVGFFVSEDETRHESYSGGVSNYDWLEGTEGFEKRPNKKFKARLKYKRYLRVRSSVAVEWLDEETNTYYYSGMNLLSDALITGIEEGGYIEGEFWFTRNGVAVLLVGNLS